jgi:hypothetical protein
MRIILQFLGQSLGTGKETVFAIASRLFGVSAPSLGTSIMAMF